MKLRYVYIDKYDKPTHIQMHYHNCFEIVFYYKTNGYATWKHSENEAADSLVFTDKEDGIYKQIDFTDDTVILIPPNILHDEKHDTPSKLTAIGFSVSPDDKELSFLNATAPFLFVDHNSEIKKLIQQIEQLYSQRTPLYKNIIELLISSILLMLCSREDKNDPSETIKFTKHYIDEHFTAPIEIDMLAKQIGYSSDHFRILFNKFVGKNPKAYILEKRLEFAKNLLHETDYSSEMISSMCGFQNPSQFNKFFKLKDGQTPLQYRIQTKK